MKNKKHSNFLFIQIIGFIIFILLASNVSAQLNLHKDEIDRIYEKIEKANQFEDAIGHYIEAYKVERYEVSSYEALLPMGRAYFLNQDIQKAKDILEKFIKEAEDQPDMWGPTEEGKKILQNDIEFAKWLIQLCKRDNIHKQMG